MTPTDIVKQIQEALEFYGNKESYIFYPLREDGNSQTDIIGSPVDKDDGKIARKKLNLIPDLLAHLEKGVSFDANSLDYYRYRVLRRCSPNVAPEEYMKACDDRHYVHPHSEAALSRKQQTESQNHD